MKKLFLPLCLLLVAPCFAQQDPEEIIMDFGIDEFIYVPKSTLNFGARYMTGAKVSFGGKGFVGSFVPAGDATTGNVQRVYDNGSFVTKDTGARKDANGNAITDGSDGFTNNWYYANSNQKTADGNIAMKSYTADISDTGTLQKDPGAGTGVEVVVTRDFGRLFGTSIRWGITGGASLNDIHSNIKQRELVADITMLTDVYAPKPGVTVPDAPYQGPTNTYEQKKNEDGTPVFEDDGVTAVLDYEKPVDTTTVISNKPIDRTITTETGKSGLVNTSFLLKGNYYTFRVGPTFYIPITERLRATINVGASAIYAGTNYRVVTLFTPEDGTQIPQDIESDESELLMGYYVDANVEYTFTESTGLYLGAVYQTSGSYDQTVTSPTGQAVYTTRIDLKQLQGLRAGMTYRF